MRRAHLSLLLLLAACTPRADRIIIGSKNFTEQDILSEIVAQQIERRTDLKVERKFHLGGTFLCHRALISGQIDAYVEYTGTALVAILQHRPVRDRDAALNLVFREYLQTFHVVWLAPLGFNNTFAMIVRASDANRLGIRTISDAARFAPQWRAGFGYEFTDRADGYPGLARLYGLKFSVAAHVMDLGLTYRALADSVVDIIAGNSTDGQIEALHLVALEDDRQYFPAYEAAPVVREAVLLRHPEVRKALAELAGTIGDTTMRRLNYLVDVEHRTVPQVAREFLAERVRGIISRRSDGRAGQQVAPR